MVLELTGRVELTRSKHTVVLTKNPRISSYLWKLNLHCEKFTLEKIVPQGLIMEYGYHGPRSRWFTDETLKLTIIHQYLGSYTNWTIMG